MVAELDPSTGQPWCCWGCDERDVDLLLSVHGTIYCWSCGLDECHCVANKLEARFEEAA